MTALYMTSSLSPERYLNNKEYFDSSLILLLEKQEIKIKKLKDTVEIQKATIYKYSGNIKALRLNLKNSKNMISSLQTQLKRENRDSQEIINRLRKEIDNISTTVNDELQEAYKTNKELNEDNKRLNDEIKRLNEELKKLRLDKKNSQLNSTNSSKPSSTDGFLVRPNMRKATSLKRGGQTGHKVHRSKMHASPSKIIIKHVTKAPSGAKAVKDENNEIIYYCTQEIDARLITSVTETRYFIIENGAIPDKSEMRKYAVNPVTYTPQLIAMILYLNNKGGIALNRLCIMLGELSKNDIDVKPSTIVKWMKRFNDKSISSKKEILDEILDSPVVCADETGWRENGKNAWFHVITNDSGAYFTVTKKRSDKESGPLAILKEYEGTVIHDHFKSYYNLENCTHGECNAHILRYLKAGVDGYGDLYCAKMIKLLQKMIHEKKTAISEKKNNFEENKIKEYETEYLEIAAECIEKYEKENPDIKTKYIPEYIKVFKRMIEYKDEHLLFIRDFSVPCDNNTAERQARAIKAKKKISGQSYSIDTANYFASMLTIMQTCRLKNENTLTKIEDILAS